LSGISRPELVARLAEVSHLTYVRQKNRDHGVPLQELSLEVTDHDRERAEDTVAELERLGVYPASGSAEPKATGSATGPASSEPGSEGHERAEASPPPTPEQQGKPVTDLWGRPLGSRRRRR
jgi:hypothetical protein